MGCFVGKRACSIGIMELGVGIVGGHTAVRAGSSLLAWLRSMSKRRQNHDRKPRTGGSLV